jgi:hypothetical protein
LEDGYLHSLEQAIFGDSMFLDIEQLIRSEEKLHCNAVSEASLVEERRQLEFSMVESFYVNHGGTKQVGETCVYAETRVWSMNENYAGEDIPSFGEGLEITNE